MAKKQEAVKVADRMMADLEQDVNNGSITPQQRHDRLVAISVLRQVAGQAADLRRQYCRGCKEAKCGICVFRWIQGLIGERPPKYKGEERN